MPLSQKTVKKKRKSPPVHAKNITAQARLSLSKTGDKVDTTIGDLVCAIYDAANEVSRNEKLVNHLTQLAVNNILKKKAQKKP